MIILKRIVTNLLTPLKKYNNIIKCSYEKEFTYNKKKTKHGWYNL